MNDLPKYFDWKFYLSINEDLLDAGLKTQEDAIKHYLKYGQFENRKFNSDLPNDFDWRFYLENNKDLQISGLKNEEDAINHYLDYGQFEKRSYCKHKTSKKIKKYDKYNEEDFIELCSNLIKYLPSEYPKIDKNSEKKSLIVETRNRPHNEFIIKNTIQKLGDGWGNIIYCHKNNFDQIKKICDEISNDIEINFLDTEIDRNVYNTLFLDLEFWNKINCEKVLVYQTDTFISKKFDDNFLIYDYLAGQWSNQHSEYLKKKIGGLKLKVGNGGLSLRNVSKIKECLMDKDFLDKYMNILIDDSLELIPEDTLYSIYFSDKLPSLQINSDFSSESYLNKNSFGIHKPWNLFKNLEEELNKLFFTKEKKRILFINHHESRTGAPILLKNLIEFEIRERDFDVWILSLEKGDDNWNYKNKMYFEDLLGNKNSEKASYLQRVLNPDFIYANTIISMDFAKHFTCNKLISINEYRSLFSPSINIKDLINFDKILVGCDEIKKFLKIYNIDSVVNPYFLDFDTLLKNYFVSAGFAQLRKGLHRFIEIASLMPDRNFKWIGSLSDVEIQNEKIIIKGQNFLLPEYKSGDEIKEVTITCDLPKNVELVGLKDTIDTYNLISNSDCFLMLSTDDTFPLVVVNAKISNTKVVTLKESGDSYKICDENDLILEKYEATKIVDYLRKTEIKEKNINRGLLEYFKNNLEINRKEYLKFLEKKIKVFIPIESESNDFSFELLSKSLTSLKRFDFDIKIITDKLSKKTLEVANGIEIIEYNFEIAEYVKKFYTNGDYRCFGGIKSSSISRSYFKLEVANICKKMNYDDKFVLYCDSDIICNKDFTNKLPYYIKYIAGCPEWDKTNLDYFNAGILWINVNNFHNQYSKIKNHIFQDLYRLDTHDQQALNEIFKSIEKIESKDDDLYFDNLDLRLNWKPYWGITDDFYIAHYHWSKPNTGKGIYRNASGDEFSLDSNTLRNDFLFIGDENIDVESILYYSELWNKN